MPTDISIQEEQTPQVSPGFYSPVTVYMKDSLGAIFLGILSGILLLAWMRSEARYRALVAHQGPGHGSRSLDA